MYANGFANIVYASLSERTNKSEFNLPFATSEAFQSELRCGALFPRMIANFRRRDAPDKPRACATKAPRVAVLASARRKWFASVFTPLPKAHGSRARSRTDARGAVTARMKNDHSKRRCYAKISLIAITV